MYRKLLHTVQNKTESGKNVVKMKLKTNTSLLVLYVCYWPGLEDRSSGPGIGHAHILRLFEVGQEK